MSFLATLLRNLTRLSVYRRLVVSYLMVTGITIGTVSIVLFVSFSRQTTAEIARVSEEATRQLSEASDAINREVLYVGNYLLAHRDVATALFARDVDRLREFRAVLAFNQIKDIYPSILYTAAFNGRTGRYVNTQGLAFEDESAFLASLAANPRALFVRVFPRMTESADQGRGRVAVVTFVFAPDLFSTSATPSYLLINVDAAYIRRLIAARLPSLRSRILLLDDELRLIADTVDSPFLAPMEESRLLAGVRSGSATSGSHTFSIDGTRTLITYKQSAELKWWLVSARPHADFLGSIRRLRNATLAASAALLMLGAGIALLAAGRMYNPIRSLLGQIGPEIAGEERLDEFRALHAAYSATAQRVSALQHSLQENLLLVRNNHARSLLLGAGGDAPSDSDLARQVAEAFAAPAYVVLAARIDDYERVRRTLALDAASVTVLAVARTLSDLLSPTGHLATVQLDEAHLASIVGVATRDIPQHLLVALMDVQRAVHAHAGVTVSVGVGTPVANRDQIPLSLAAARRNLLYRFFRGREALVRTEDIEVQAGTHASLAQESTRRIAEALRAADEKSGDRELKACLRLLAGASYYSALHGLVQLGHVIRSAAGIPETSNIAAVDEPREFFEDAAADLERLCRDAIRDARTGRPDRRALLITEVKRIVEERCADPGLNIAHVADSMRLSAGYLSRLFREEAGESFGDHLTDLRMRKAQELLLDGRLTIQAVSERVGIANSRYFFTLFRKHTGTTPRAFRERAAKTGASQAPRPGAGF